MLDPSNPSTGFFSTDPEVVLASLPLLARSRGEVTSSEGWLRVAGETALRGPSGSIFDDALFGDDRFGHLRCDALVHPALVPYLVEPLGLLGTPDVVAVLQGRKAIRAGNVVTLDGFADEGDVSGPVAVAEAVRAARPDWHLLPLVAINQIPVPPLATRPSRRLALPEAVDGWEGPVNEAWRALALQARQGISLAEFETPPAIVAQQRAQTQGALLRAFRATRQAERRLLPPLLRARVPDADEAGQVGPRDVVQLALAGTTRLVVQQNDAVRVLTLDGEELLRTSPCGCELRGVVGGRWVVFQGLRRDHHPEWSQHGLWPSSFSGHALDDVEELSVFDLTEARWLTHAPEGLPHHFFANPEPERLALGERELLVDDDRPDVLAYSHDLRFARISGGTIVDVENALTVARPAQLDGSEIEQALDLRTGRKRAHQFNGASGVGEAILWHAGRWLIVDSDGMLSDHLGAEPIALVPPPALSVFEPTGRRLLCLVKREVVTIDLATRTVLRRFAIDGARRTTKKTKKRSRRSRK